MAVGCSPGYLRALCCKKPTRETSGGVSAPFQRASVPDDVSTLPSR